MFFRSVPLPVASWLALAAVTFASTPGCRRDRAAAPPAGPSSDARGPSSVAPAAGRPDAGARPRVVAKSASTPPPKPRAALPGDLPAGRQLVLLHSANLHGEYDAHPLGGLARRATLTAQQKAAVAGLLQVDAGDSLLPPLQPAAGEPPADKTEVDRRARLIADGLGRIGLHALVPGEADLQLGVRRYREIARRAKLPVLVANLVDARGKRLFDAAKLVSVAGVQVGIFGVLTVAEADAKALAADKMTVGDPLGAAQSEISLLRERGADLVVGLAHLAGGLGEARTLAGNLTGVDVLVLGHEPQAIVDPVLVGDPASGGTSIVAAGERGRYLGKLALTAVEDDQGFAVPRAQPGTVQGSWLDHEIVRLDPRVISDPGMLAFLAPYIAETRRRIEKKLPVGLSFRAGTKGELADSTDEHWTYATTPACSLCHGKQKEHFDLTFHAFSLATLERKGRHRDPYCLGCHSTGFDKPGGTKNLETANRFFGTTGCESCHGPSVAHVRGQTKVGTTLAVPEAVCLECHKPEHSPEPFDYASALKEVLGPGHGG